MQNDLQNNNNSPFKSFFMGGFECSDLKFWDGRRIDVIDRVGHDTQCAEDYRMLTKLGIGTVRDGIRWHKIEKSPGVYDWDSWKPMLAAASETGMQVIWDLCHYGMPDYITDPLNPDMPKRYADFAGAAGELFKAECGAETPIWSPMNEISFWVFGANGDAGNSVRPWVWPARAGCAQDLKGALVKALIDGTRRLREINPEARFLQPEPMIHYVTKEGDDPALCERRLNGIYEVWDMMAGKLRPELGGGSDILDIIGINFYYGNVRYGDESFIPFGSEDYVPFSKILRNLHERYGRPLLIAETGSEHDNGPGWLRKMAGEIRHAAEHVPVYGQCIYPSMDYPGWVDERHISCGFIKLDDDLHGRNYNLAMVEALIEQQFLMNHAQMLKEQATELLRPSAKAPKVKFGLTCPA